MKWLLTGYAACVVFGTARMISRWTEFDRLVDESHKDVDARYPGVPDLIPNWLMKHISTAVILAASPLLVAALAYRTIRCLLSAERSTSDTPGGR